jgi:hypothetical protein
MWSFNLLAMAMLLAVTIICAGDFLNWVGPKVRTQLIVVAEEVDADK